MDQDPIGRPLQSIATGEETGPDPGRDSWRQILPHVRGREKEDGRVVAFDHAGEDRP